MLYVLERWLYRAAISPHADLLVLKGGLLLAALDARRPTRDGDLLAFMQRDEDDVVQRICQIAGIVVDDGVTFHIDGVRRCCCRGRPSRCWPTRLKPFLPRRSPRR